MKFELKIVLRRLLAFLVDVNLAFWLGMIGMFVSVEILFEGDGLAGGEKLMAVLLFYLFFGLFMILKDIWISPGRLLFDLRVYDEKGKRASLGQRLLRNITFPILPAEMIIFLIIGKRSGDILAKTTVNSRKARVQQ